MHSILKINSISLISDQMHFLYLIFYLIDICIQLSNMKLFMAAKFNENVLFQQAYVINLKGDAEDITTKLKTGTPQNIFVRF